jgi:hypothetical protein
LVERNVFSSHNFDTQGANRNRSLRAAIDAFRNSSAINVDQGFMKSNKSQRNFHGITDCLSLNFSHSAPIERLLPNQAFRLEAATPLRMNNLSLRWFERKIEFLHADFTTFQNAN